MATSNFIIFTFLASMAVISFAAIGEDYDYAETLDRKTFGLKTEKLTKFRVYWQDILSGSHPTSMEVVKPVTKTGFGSVRMIDNLLTAGPDVGSKLVGRAQGFYALASQHEIGILMVMNFAFVEGKYNGSTLSVIGRNSILFTVRELSVVGGSGLFRFARGYVELRTKMFNLTNGDATVEYTCYVLHY